MCNYLAKSLGVKKSKTSIKISGGRLSSWALMFQIFGEGVVSKIIVVQICYR